MPFCRRCKRPVVATDSITAPVEKLLLAALVFFGGMPKTGQVKALAVVDTGIAILYLMYFAGL
jgi:hypothetical protein